MLSAISFGVFCREEPSTSAIIRSRKLSPGRCVTRTTIRSERTRVPPVTAERSPPDSRITGADSPVIADSSTLAIPSITSPSAGISSPAATTTTSPSARPLEGTSSRVPSWSRRWARVSARVRRSASACALPRPSAIASARFANRTVNQSQAAINQAKTHGSAIAITRDEHASELDHEHHRVACHPAWIELSHASTDARRRICGSSKAVCALIAPVAPRSARGRGRGSRSGRRRSARPRAAAR